MQAMILAAGLGSRLRPLTETCPKPLIPVGGKPLVDYHLERLAALGITDVMMNVSYLASQVQAHCGDGSRYGLNIRYSLEPEGPLGVLGGVESAIECGLNGSFFLISSDIWVDMLPTDLFLTSPFEPRLLVIPKPACHAQGDFGLDEAGCLTVDNPTYTYAGMALLDTTLFDSSFKSFVDMLTHHIGNALIRATVYEGVYFNVGTAEELSKVEAYLSEKYQSDNSDT